MTDRVFRKTKFIWILLMIICVLTGCGKKAAGETTSMDQLEERIPEPWWKARKRQRFRN